MATDKHQVLGGLKFPVPTMSESHMLVSDMGNPPGCWLPLKLIGSMPRL